MVDCTSDDQGAEFTVQVEVRVALRPRLSGAPHWAHAQAKAGRVGR